MIRRGDWFGLRAATALVAVGVAALAAWPAWGARPAAPPRRGGVLRVAEQADPAGFDTLGKKKATIQTQLALAYTHNRLLKYDPSGEVVSDLAERWTQPTPTTYVVTLRRGVRFHNKPPLNGRELTSEDVKFTFERLGKSAEARLFPTLKTVTTPDRYTVRFELSSPFSSFTTNLAATTVYIYAKEAGRRTSDGAGDYRSAESAIGTGPFMLEEHHPRQRIVFKRNPDYFEHGKPYVDGVELFTMTDPAGQVSALRAGKLDLIPASRGEGLPSPLVPEARAVPGARVIVHGLFQTSENLAGRIDLRPWIDVRVRRAVSMAIDRPGLVRAMFPEGAEPFSGPVPATSRYFVPLARLGDAAAWYRHDVPAAKKLLAAAGYPKGLSVRLTTTVGYGPAYVARSETVIAMLRKVGIDASLALQEYPVWTSSTSRGNFEGLAHMPASTLHDEDEWLQAYTPGDARNQLHLDESKLTGLIQSARTAPDEAARARSIQRFVTTFHERMYRVFLPAPKVVTVTGARVQGYVPPSRGYAYATALVNTWLSE